MSLPSPKKSDVLIVADSWVGWLAASYFIKEGCKPSVVYFDREVGTHPLPIFIGTGEVFAISDRILGSVLAEFLWDTSAQNLSMAQDWFHLFKVPSSEGTLIWYGNNEKEKGLFERSQSKCKELRFKNSSTLPSFSSELHQRVLYVDFENLNQALKKYAIDSGVDCFRAEKVRFSGGSSNLSYSLELLQGGQHHKLETSIVLFLAEREGADYFPWMEEKLIPVTLPSFVFRRKKDVNATLAHFNLGLDYAVQNPGGDELRLGSYRNLYQDKGVGILNSVDPVARRGIQRFFSERGWISQKQDYQRAYLSVETVSCDGLPVIGSLPEAPGIYVFGGFSARTQNYAFYALQSLIRNVVKGGSFDSLRHFSTKRFV